MAVFDFKKVYKEQYLPKTSPALITMEPVKYIMVDGQGAPAEDAYQSAVEILFSISYAIRMWHKDKEHELPDGYFEYVVAPLEGLWWQDTGVKDYKNKADFKWIAMVRQPDFVTEEVFQAAGQKALKKKKYLDISRARLETYDEGLCAQIMHLGSYDDEEKTVAELEKFIAVNNLRNLNGIADESGFIRRHHEIYTVIPKANQDVSNLKTVIRYPVG